MKYISKFAILLRSISLTIIISTLLLIIIPNILGIKTNIDYIGSMNPKIKRGSISYVNKHKKFNKIVKNEIIGVNYKNQDFTSRVISINKDKTLTIKGDAENDNEALKITNKEYVGKVLFSIPYLGKIILFLQNNFLLTTLLILFMILSLAFELVCDEENNYRLENTIVRMMKIKDEELEKENKIKKKKEKKEKKEKVKRNKKKENEDKNDKQDEKIEKNQNKEVKETTKEFKIEEKKENKNSFNEPVILEAKTIEITTIKDNNKDNNKKTTGTEEPVILEFKEVDDDTPEFIELLEAEDEELEKTQVIKQIKEMYNEENNDK